MAARHWPSGTRCPSIPASLAALLLAANLPAAGATSTIDTIAGGGPHDVPALQVWIEPSDLAVDAAGDIYFPSRARSRIYRVDTAGILHVVAGTGIGHARGDGGPIERASFLLPDQIAFERNGNLLVYGGDDPGGCCNPEFGSYNHLDRLLRRLNFGTGLMELVVGPGTHGTISTPLDAPSDLMVAPNGDIWLAEYALITSENIRIGWFEYLDALTGSLVHAAGNGDFLGGPLADGSPASSVSLLSPGSVAMHSPERLLIQDGEHQRTRVVDLTTGLIDSYAPAAGLYGALAFDEPGNLYIGELTRVWRVDASTGAITHIAGDGTLPPASGSVGDGGPAVGAPIYVGFMDLDAAGNLYIGGKGRIRRVDAATGIIDTVAGDPSADRFGNGGPATQATLRLPVDVAVDPATDDVYVAEAGWTAVRKIDAATGVISSLFRHGYGDTGAANTTPPSLASVALHDGAVYYSTYATFIDLPGWVHANEVRRFDPATGTDAVVAGFDRFPGCEPDGQLASMTRLFQPHGIDFDAAGNLYIAETTNNKIRRVDAVTGIITTVAGSGTPCGTRGDSGDGGPATQALLNRPEDVSVDAAGNVYIADTFNGRVRRVDAATGIISTVAAVGGAPRSVEVDSQGNLFVGAGERIYRVGAISGATAPVAGDGVFGFYGDGGPPLLAALGTPRGMAFDAAGDLLVASYEPGRIRKLSLPEPPMGTAAATPDLLWPPNHQMVEVHVDVDASGAPAPLTIALVSITPSEPDDAPGGSDGTTTDDIQEAGFGTADFDFLLRAERAGSGTGRSYEIVYAITAGSGLFTTATTYVTVPHDQGGVVDPVSLSIAESAAGSVLAWGEVPGAHSYNVIRGDLGSIHDAPEGISLGGVSCIEVHSRDLDTIGDEDAEVPEPGRGFFYVAEYRDPHGSTYGSPFAPKPRRPDSGQCP